MKREDQLVQWATDMFDLLVANPDGLTRDAIMSSTGMQTVKDFHDAKGILQDICGTNDTINIVGDSSTSMNGGWTYTLQGDPSNPEARGYQIRKMRNMFGRQYRAYMVAKALVKGTNGNTAIGRSVRRMARSIYNTLVETADAMDELGAKAPALPPPV